jgi:hypothetical protein
MGNNHTQAANIPSLAQEPASSESNNLRPVISISNGIILSNVHEQVVIPKKPSENDRKGLIHFQVKKSEKNKASMFYYVDS